MSETNASLQFDACIPSESYLMSPDLSATSASDITYETFKQIANVEEVDDMKELLPYDADLSDLENTDKTPSTFEGIDGKVKESINETNMNSHVEEDFLNNGLASWKGRGVKKESHGQTKVIESQLLKLFAKLYHECPPNFNGLPVTILSQPDFAFWHEGNQLLVMGEGKNATYYTPADALRQCVAYLIANLYHCVVLQQKPVEAVYGFTLCGSKCQCVDEGELQLDLISLSLPKCIGGMLEMRHYRSNSTKDLATFLNILSKIPPTEKVAATAGAVISLGCPSLLKIPREMLLTTPPKSWSVVKNATSALVMKLNNDGALEYLSESGYVSTDEKKQISRLRNKRIFTFPCYLKVKNMLGTHCPQNLVYTSFLDQDYGNLGEIYIANFPTDVGLFIFMNDMGRPIAERGSLRDTSSFKNFIPLFCDLVKRTMFLVNEGFFHGDIHLWNVVVDRKNEGTGRGGVMKLHLIDYDEAKIGSIDKRIPMAGNERHKRRYVQSLLQNRETCKAYSRNQIVNLFCECWELLFEKNETDSNVVVKDATNNFMRKYHARFVDGMEDISVEEVDEFYDEMIQVLTICEDDEMEDNSGEEVNKSVELMDEDFLSLPSLAESIPTMGKRIS